jgi:aspartate aminotransferase-like enzyme
MRLMTPGPVPVPDFVLQAIQKPVIHHRSEDFATLFASVRAGLQYLFQTESATGTVIGSGTYGVEMAMYSLFRPQEKVLVLNMGKFSERWVDYGKLIGLEVRELKADWGEGISVPQVVEAVKQYPELKGIVITHSETSTGVAVDLEELAFAVKGIRPDILLVVDAITSVGAMPFYFDAWQVDCALTASQKCLLNPAGIAAYALSPLAIRALRPSHTADFRNLFYYGQKAAVNSYPYTAPVQLLYGIEAALDHIRKRGLPAIWNQVHHCAQAFRKGLTELKGSVFADPPSESLTAFSLPARNMAEVQQQLQQKGFYLAGGQGALKGKILRVSHFGGWKPGDMQALLRAMR